MYRLPIHNYEGKTGYFEVDPKIVDNLFVVIAYTITGDEVYAFVTFDGEIYSYDACDCIEGSAPRLMDLGPDDMHVIFPEEIQWEKTYAA